MLSRGWARKSLAEGPATCTVAFVGQRTACYWAPQCPSVLPGSECRPGATSGRQSSQEKGEVGVGELEGREISLKTHEVFPPPAPLHTLKNCS